jgi:hypothetical protein
MDTKFIEVGTIGRIQLSAAVIVRVSVVICNSFAGQIIVGAQHPARYRKGAYGRANLGDSDLMGLEIAGDVTELGNEVRGFAMGDRVMGIVGAVDMRRRPALITEWRFAYPLGRRMDNDLRQKSILSGIHVQRHERSSDLLAN